MATRLTSSVRSPAAFRQQLLLNFVSNICWIQSLPGAYQILSRLQAWFATGGTAMAAATDCLLLTQFAQDAKSERWRLEALKRHSAAISTLQHALCKPRVATDDDLLSAIDALGVCEALGMGTVSANVPQGEDAWRQHALGLCTLLGLRGPVCTADERTHHVVFNAMYVGLTNNVSRGKALIFGEPRWQRALEVSCAGRMWCLFHSGCKFPALLERVDALDTVSDPAGAAVVLLSELVGLQDTLQQWLLAWYREMPGLPFRTVSITEYPPFVATHGPIADSFPAAFLFPSLIEASGHLTYWTFLLFVRQAIYDLVSQPYVKTFSTQQQRDRFWHEFRMANGGGERDLYGSMFWAARWYEQEGDHLKADFCASVLGDHMVPSGEPQASPSPAAADDFMIVGKGILLQRLVWLDCVGPTSCACASRSSFSSV
ncbi:hypothetical protein LTR85_002493 [Meristemomyces frigidus]|nr:hypothetical protein LTR85_002493 [Meristemomyces frigidus]